MPARAHELGAVWREDCKIGIMLRFGTGNRKLTGTKALGRLGLMLLGQAMLDFALLLS